MDGFKQWAAVVCTAAVVCALLRLLFPESSIGRQARQILPCVFLCALLMPLPGVFFGVKPPDFTAGDAADTADLEARMRQQVVQQVNDSLLAMVNQALRGYGWQAKKVTADMDIGEDGSISMGQITVYVDRDTARSGAAVRQIVEKRLGTAVVLAQWEETK